MTTQPWFTTTTGTSTVTYTWNVGVQRAAQQINERSHAILVANNAAKEEGDSMTGERLEAAGVYPLGTIAEHRNGSRLVRTYSGWISTEGDEYLPASMARDGYAVQKLGEAPLAETLDKFKQLFRTTVVGGAQNSGVMGRTVTNALRALEVPDYPLSPGMYVWASDRELLATLPQRTVIEVGAPDVWSHYGVFAWVNGNWHYVTGNVRQFMYLGRVIEMPGVEEQEWVKGEWSEEEQARIDTFMRTAYDIGEKARQTEQWCGTYTVVMARANITDAWMLRPRPMTQAQVRDLDVGSILFWEDDLNRAVFERDDAAAHFGLRQVWSTNEATIVPNDNDRMVALRTHDEGGWSPPRMDLLDDFPVGTCAVLDGSTRYKLPDRRWHARPYRANSAGHRVTDFNNQPSRCRVLTIGEGAWDYGTVMDTAQQRAKPEDIVFGWEQGQTWAWFIRDDTADNEAGTRRLFGSGENHADYNTTATYLGRLGSFPILEWRKLAALPLGSVMSYGGTNYTKERNLWRTNPGGYGNPDRDFDNACRGGEVLLVSLGDVNAVPPPTERQVITTVQQLYDLPDGTRLTARNGDRLIKRRHRIVNQTTYGERTFDQCWRSVEARTLTAEVEVAAEGVDQVFAVGARVQLRPGADHTSGGHVYTTEVGQGQPGTIQYEGHGSRPDDPTWSVQWDHGRASNIDQSCMEVIA